MTVKIAMTVVTMIVVALYMRFPVDVKFDPT